MDKLKKEKENLAKSIQVLGLDEDLKRNYEKVKADIDILEIKKLKASISLSKEDLLFISKINIGTLDFPKQ